MRVPYTPVEIRGRQVLEVKEIPSRMDPEDSIELIYYVKTDGDLVAVTQKIAEEETTGAWIGIGKPTPTFLAARAEPVRIELYSPSDGVITVRSPLGNVDMEADPFYQLQMLSVGGPILEFVYYSSVAYLDFNLPKKFQTLFPGPRFGIQGSRDFIGLGKEDPLIGTIIKPCCGLLPEEVAEKAEKAALGGAVLMKDDEKMMNPPYCPLETKVRAVAAGLRRAQDATGKRVIYAPHLPIRSDKLRETAMRVMEWGATGIMFNTILSNNLGALQILASDPDINVPLYAHCGGLAALTTGPRRIDAKVIAKLARFCGADYFQIGVMGQRDCHVNSLDPSLLYMLADTFHAPMDGIRDTVPVAAGGLSIKNLGLNLEAFYDKRLGYAVALLAGSNLLKHPQGPTAGAIAVRAAAEAYMSEGITDPGALAEYASRNSNAEILALLK